jgi:hypothetical protein
MEESPNNNISDNIYIYILKEEEDGILGNK